MGLILDSSILIAGERRGETVKQLMQRVRVAYGDVESALSVMSVIELTHGIYRAKTHAETDSPRLFSQSEEGIVSSTSAAAAP